MNLCEVLGEVLKFVDMKNIHRIKNLNLSKLCFLSQTLTDRVVLSQSLSLSHFAHAPHASDPIRPHLAAQPPPDALGLARTPPRVKHATHERVLARGNEVGGGATAGGGGGERAANRRMGKNGIERRQGEREN
jgi:hypothetical protein